MMLSQMTKSKLCKINHITLQQIKQIALIYVKCFYSAVNTDESAESSTAPVQPESKVRPIKAAIKETFFIVFPLL